MILYFRGAPVKKIKNKKNKYVVKSTRLVHPHTCEINVPCTWLTWKRTSMLPFLVSATTISPIWSVRYFTSLPLTPSTGKTSTTFLTSSCSLFLFRLADLVLPSPPLLVPGSWGREGVRQGSQQGCSIGSVTV